MSVTATEQAISREGGVRLHPAARRRLSVLLLCDDARGHANTVLDHIDALTKFSSHDVRIFNPRGMTSSKYLDLSEFDIVAIHYSLVIISDYYLSPHFREQLRRFQGLKIQFIQDEYRWVNDVTAMMRYLGIHVLFTLVPPQEVPKVYPGARLPEVIKIPTRAGYVPEHLAGLNLPPIEARPIDIGYRGRTLPYWLGQLAQEKVWIGQGVLARAAKYDLRCDIAWTEQDRIYGQRWIQFLSSCKATLGTESGASITDFDGLIERQTKAYLAEQPSADFHEVHRKILAPHEGNARITAISPRVFEAAALRTAMIMFPGEYSGVVQPWVHYLPLAKDFSNMDEVVEKLRDLRFVQAMTDKAYRDLVASGAYSQRSLAREFDEVLSRYGRPHGTRRKMRYRLSRLERPVAVAAGQAREAMRPLMRGLQDLAKGTVAFGLMVRTKAGREILRAHLLGYGKFRETIRLHLVLKDVLKLAVVSQACAGVMVAKRRFTVSVRFDADQGRLLFESLPFREPKREEHVRDHQVRLDGGMFWPALRSAVRERRVRTIVWNHAALGGNVQYALTPFLKLTVCVGDYDIHSFDGLVELARCAPEPVLAVLASMLDRGTFA